MKRRLSLPLTGATSAPSTLIHSPGLGMLRRVGVNQWPTTAAPITSVTNLYLCPSHDEEHRAGAAAAVGFFHGDHLRVRQIDLVLQYAGGPEDAKQVDARRLAQADENLRRRLAFDSPMRPASSHFCHRPFGEDLDLRAERGFVVGKPVRSRRTK